MGGGGGNPPHPPYGKLEPGCRGCFENFGRRGKTVRQFPRFDQKPIRHRLDHVAFFETFTATEKPALLAAENHYLRYASREAITAEGVVDPTLHVLLWRRVRVMGEWDATRLDPTERRGFFWRNVVSHRSIAER